MRGRGMDTSKEYIKMCEKWWRQAEIVWEEGSGDFVYYPPEEKIVVLYFNKHHGEPPLKYRSNPAFPLPRQDQLQRITIVSEFFSPVDQIKEFQFKIDNKNYAYYHQFKSMEQLWLAFVMEEKYGKIWIGNEWIANPGGQNERG